MLYKLTIILIALFVRSNIALVDSSISLPRKSEYPMKVFYFPIFSYTYDAIDEAGIEEEGYDLSSLLKRDEHMLRLAVSYKDLKSSRFLENFVRLKIAFQDGTKALVDMRGDVKFGKSLYRMNWRHLGALRDAILEHMPRD